MPQGIGINRRHWRNAQRAAQRAQRRRDELEIETLLDEAGIEDEDERAAIGGERCAQCGSMLLRVTTRYPRNRTAATLLRQLS